MREANYRALTQSFPELLRIFTTPLTPPSFQHSFIATNSGYPSLMIEGKHVHSPRDPIREAERIAATVPDREAPLVVLGFGLGYLPLALRQRFPHRPLIIIERHGFFIQKALELVDLSPLFLSTTETTKGSLFWIIGGEPAQLLEILRRIEAEQFHPIAEPPPDLITNPTLYSLDREWYDPFLEALHHWEQKHRINRNTLRKFGKRWVSNLLHNLPEIQNTPGITYFSQKLQGIPTLIVAAGPSLDELRPFLKELYDRCCIIAVDTALRFLLQEGVAPDFVMVMDPQYWNYRHLDHCSLEQSVLITDTTVYPGVFRTKRRTTFFCNTPSPLGLWVEQSLAQRGLLGAGGSVATSAWDFARYTGAHPLWIGGLDLGFPDYQTHYKGALFEERTHTRAFRFRPQATELFQVLRSGNPRQRYAMDGQPLWTDERMLLYAHWFEERFAHYPEAVPRSLSSRGLAIRGLQKGSLEELLAMPLQRQKINETLRQLVVEAQAQFEATFPLSEREKILSQWIQRAWQELEHLEKGVDKIGLSSKRGWVPLCIESGQHPFPTTQTPSLGHTKSKDQFFLYTQASPLSPLLDFVMASLQNEGSENPESIKIQSGSIQKPPLSPGTGDILLQGINYLKSRLTPYLFL
ncbi:MAG: DUF115 domain-containing protein [Treponemataceae bacterium]|nr:DUF115 domain-containing protein [Treponemataceae bacterium]